MPCLPLVSGEGLVPATNTDNGTVTINVTKVAVREATAAILRSKLMCQGSIHTQKKRHKKKENLASVAQRLAKITKVSSGAIESQGIYHLWLDIHAKVVWHNKVKQATEADVVNKQAEKEEVQKGKAQ
jgi:hypothetical protein